MSCRNAASDDEVAVDDDVDDVDYYNYCNVLWQSWNLQSC